MTTQGAATGPGGWRWYGQARPDFAHAPGAGQRSVWDFPRPPVLRRVCRAVRVEASGGPLARSERALQVCETASPPTVYLPPEDCALDRLVAIADQSACEWKGAAEYLSLAGDGNAVAWRYPSPWPDYAAITGWLAFYPSRVACWLGGERVRAQAGGFYGGWVTDDLAGPWKGETGQDW